MTNKDLTRHPGLPTPPPLSSLRSLITTRVERGYPLLASLESLANLYKHFSSLLFFMVTFIRERKQKWMERFHVERVVVEEHKMEEEDTFLIKQHDAIRLHFL